MPAPDPTPAVVRAWTRLIRAQRAALQAIRGDLKAAKLPPLEWYDALLELERAGPAGLRPLQLEDRLLLEQHNVSRLLDRLATAGLIERRPCPQDKRGQVVVITAVGAALRAAMWPTYRAAIARHVGAPLGDDAAAAQLAALLDRMLG
jgi:DNA-binding MarR family transcriptional regulator